MNRLIPSILLWVVLFGALLSATAAGEESAGGTDASVASDNAIRTPATDLYALTDSVARRAKELDAADQRMAQERKLLDQMKDEVSKQIAELDKKLAELEKGRSAKDMERKAAKAYIARVYKAMAVEDAARRLQLMGETETAAILRELKEKDAAKILARFEPEYSVAVTRLMEK